MHNTKGALCLPGAFTPADTIAGSAKLLTGAGGTRRQAAEHWTREGAEVL